MRGPLKSVAEKFGKAFKNNAKKAINEGSSFVSKNAESAYKIGKSTAIKTARTASKEVSGSFDRAYKQGKDATLSQVAAASTRASSVVRDASSNLASSARAASKEASHVVRDASSNIASNAKEAAKEAAVEAKKEATKGIRWLMWWSLAAIGVYGVSTTVSKELVRHVLMGPIRKEERAIESSQEEQSGSGDRSSGRWSWQTSDETKASEQNDDAGDTRSSWSSWGGRSS